MELLRASAADPEAFGVLYDRYATDLLAFFYRRTACAQTAADLVAETFAQAFAARGRFEDRGLGAMPWLFTIARRQLARFLRQRSVSRRLRRRLGMREVPIDDASRERIEQEIDLAPVRRRVAAAMDALPRGQASAVRLRVVQELPYQEVAARLGCSVPAARVRVSRGLAGLAQRLGQEGGCEL